MKFTAKNFRTAFPEAGITDSDLIKHYELAAKSKPEDYKNSETVKRMIDLLVLQLNQRYEKETQKKETSKKTVSVEKKPKKSAEAKPKKEKEAKQPKPKKERSCYTGDYVEKIQPSVAFIKRYIHLHGKTISEAKDSAIRLLASLQKAIVEKQIRKNDAYADEIMKIQDNLIKMSEMRKSEVAINITNIEQLREIAKTQRVSNDVVLIKQFLSIQGKENVKEKAQSLLEKITKSATTSTQIAHISHSLKKYIEGSTPTPEADTQTLQGLYGLAGVEFEMPKSGTSIPSTYLLAAKFDTMDFTGKWANFIGKPNRNFKIMIYGKAGKGKSTFALKFAHYLASSIGLRVLYVAGEEKIGGTLQEKIERLNVAHPYLYVVDKLEKDLSKYDVIFIDSVNTLNLEPSDLERLPNDKAYVWILQCTKNGNYRGSQAFEHNADTVIELADMTARMGKNRFGGKEKEFKI